MKNDFYVNMCKNEVERKTIFHSLTINCIEEYEGKNVLYFDCIKHNQPAEIKISHDKKGHWTQFELEYRLEGYEDWNWLDCWESHIK